jgi:hypothetical protein
MLRHIKVGEIEIPKDYWVLTKEDKRELCEHLVDELLTVLDNKINPDFNRLTILDHLLTSSILTNEELENYEICQVLNDLRILINEQNH